jgi:hypothetical protein
MTLNTDANSRTISQLGTFLRERRLFVTGIALCIGLATIFFLLSRADLHRLDLYVDRCSNELQSTYGHSDLTDADKKAKLFYDMMTAARLTSTEDIFRHLSIAFGIAALLIIFVDSTVSNATRRDIQNYTEEVSRSVWTALFQRFVPPAISAEIENILRRDVCYIRPHYHVTLCRPYHHIPSGKIVVQRVLHYRLLNLTRGDTTYLIRARMVSHVEDQEVKDEKNSIIVLPRITEVKIGGHEVPITGRMTQFSESVKLPKMDSEDQAIDIVIGAEEIFEKRDRTLYVVTEMAIGPEITVTNELSSEIEVQFDKLYLTSGTERLRETTPTNKRFDGGVLPGSAIVLSWRPRAPAESRAEIARTTEQGKSPDSPDRGLMRFR